MGEDGTCGCKRESTLLGPQCVSGEGDTVFSRLSHHLLSEPFFLPLFSSLLILVTRGLHGEFLSLTFLLASALGEACHVLWLMGRQDGEGKIYQTIEPCRSFTQILPPSLTSFASTRKLLSR